MRGSNMGESLEKHRSIVRKMEGKYKQVSSTRKSGTARGSER